MNSHLHFLISTIEIIELNNAKEYDYDATSETQGLDSRTDLKSHAKMPVVGQNWYILSDAGTFSEVNAFSPYYETKNIPIVGASVWYDCSHSMMTYILLIQNALYVTSITNSLIPPFMMQETGIIVYGTPKIQVENPTIEDHSIYFQETVLIIPLQLWGVV